MNPWDAALEYFDEAGNLLDCIPPRRIGDVVYFNPADAEYPVGFNPLSARGNRHLVASGVVEAFKSVWGQFFGPRMEYILYAAVAALRRAGGTTAELNEAGGFLLFCGDSARLRSFLCHPH